MNEDGYYVLEDGTIINKEAYDHMLNCVWEVYQGEIHPDEELRIFRELEDMPIDKLADIFYNLFGYQE